MATQETGNSTQQARPSPGDDPAASSLVVAAIDLVRTRWRLMLITLLVVEALFLLFAFIKTPVYRGEVLLAPQTRSLDEAGLGSLGGQIGGLSSLLKLGTGSSPENDFSLAVLDSHQFMSKFIQDENLLPVLFSSRWDAGRNAWRSADASEHPTIQEGVRFFNRKVKTVSKDLTTGMVKLRIHWKDRNAAAKWANDLAARLNEEVRRRAATDSERLVMYLSKRVLEAEQTEVRQALLRAMEVELKRQALVSVSDEYAFRIVDHAVAPDADAYVIPNRPLLALIGLVLGLVCAVVFAALSEHLRSVRRAEQRAAG